MSKTIILAKLALLKPTKTVQNKVKIKKIKMKRIPVKAWNRAIKKKRLLKQIKLVKLKILVKHSLRSR